MYHEHQTDALAAPAANRIIDGDDATFAALGQPTRVGNYVQTSRKTFMISGPTEAVTKAGRRSEIARQGMKAMAELKRDMEYALVGNQGSSAGSASVARSSAGMESWIAGPSVSTYSTTSGSVVTGTSTSGSTTIGFAAGVVAAPTDGTTVGPLTEAAYQTSLRLAWERGGNPRITLAGPTQKNAINGFTGIAQRQVQVNARSDVPILGSASVYVSDYGTHEIILHRYMRSSVVLNIDPAFWGIAYLRRPFMETLAKTGDAEKREMLTDFCLVSRNYQSSSKVAGLS